MEQLTFVSTISKQGKKMRIINIPKQHHDKIDKDDFGKQFRVTLTKIVHK